MATTLHRACQEPGSTWFYRTIEALTCPYRESGGVRCEVIGKHDVHKIGSHTISHHQWGNGFPCSSILPE